MNKLEEIREKLKAQISQKEMGNLDKSIYPFWNLPDNSYSEIRFLPDGDPDNTFFWVEKSIIKLPFNGTINGTNNTDKEVFVQVPCMETYGKVCPILQETKSWWKDEQLKDLARIYWRKKSYIFHGFVVKDGLNEDSPPENPIRKFIINTSIYEIIKNTLMDPDIEDLVTDFDNGRDFRLQKTKKGQIYADYSTSRFSLKTRSLSKLEREIINEHGLPIIKNYLPPQPDNKTINIIMEMFHASVNGEAYDFSKWGNYFRPTGLNNTSPMLEKPTEGEEPKLKIQRKVSSLDNIAESVKIDDDNDEDSNIKNNKINLSPSRKNIKNEEIIEENNEEEDNKASRILDIINKIKKDR